jgi:LAGLIDADG endonuclease
MIKIIKYSAHNSGFQVKLEFKITQHSRDEQLMKNLISFFGCGRYVSNNHFVDFIVIKFKDLINIIIPFFLPRRGGNNIQL